jgi:hypothetical protein
MPSAAFNETARGIFVPPEQVEAYLACGWSIADHSTAHSVLILPPKASSKANAANQTLKGGVSRETSTVRTP